MYNQQGGGQHSQHNLRFYILLITLVVGGIFFLLFLNDSDGFSLTNAIVSVAKNDSGETAEVTAQDVPWVEEERTIDEVFSSKIQKNANEVDLALSFDEIPSVKKKVKVRGIELQFNDLATKILVNDDLLELNNLEEVDLKIEGFVGNLRFDRSSFSLDGTAKSIKVNDISLSSKGQIKIAFDHLDYDYLSLEDIELDQLELPIGSGQMTVGEKLTYTLEQDQVKMYYFNGKVVIDRNAVTLLTLEGIAKGISAGGALLNLNLR